MLEESRRLSDMDLAAVADLERRVVDHDGGRLKLEWGTLRSRGGEAVEDLLWRSGDQVVGFLGLYAFGGLELAGMVDPAVRRTGIGTAMLAAAAQLGRERGFEAALLVTPRATVAGAAFAESHAGTLDHSEHFLVLGATPDLATGDRRVALRPATAADSEEVVRILAAAFEEPPRELVLGEQHDPDRTWVVARDGVVVGTVRLSRHGEVGAVYGFAVDPVVQGQGIGRTALQLATDWLRRDGADRITLEVETDNDRALGLYLSVGFERQATDDYFRIRLD